MLMLDRKFWVEIGLPVAMLGLVGTQTFIMANPPAPAVAEVAAAVVTPVLSNTWWLYAPLAGMAVLVGINSFVLFKQKRQGKGPFLRGLVNVGYGQKGGDYIQLVAGAALYDFREDFKFAVVVGLTDPAEDKYEDTRMSISNAFPIAKENTEVLIPREGPLGDGINEMHLKNNPHLRPAQPGFRQPKRGKKVQVNLHITTWMEVVLLPKGTDSKLVKRLADVRRLNGKILTEEIAEGRITQAW